MATNTWYNGSKILVAVFEGWNDAAEAASAAVSLLQEQLGLIELIALDAEEYIDFQYNRPMQSRSETGQLTLKWPGFRFYGPASTENVDNQVFLLHGNEPSRKWQTFVAEVLEVLAELDIERLVILGAVLADVPHTRSITITKTSNNPDLILEIDAKKSEYQGPVGITHVLGQATAALDIKTVHIWASVPHYVHTPPSPKATLAILETLESLIGTNLDLAELTEQAQSWEKGIDKISDDDDDMKAYINQLESARDTVEAPEASGDAIAQEFEKFLRSGDED